MTEDAELIKHIISEATKIDAMAKHHMNYPHRAALLVSWKELAALMAYMEPIAMDEPGRVYLESLRKKMADEDTYRQDIIDLLYKEPVKVHGVRIMLM